MGDFNEILKAATDGGESLESAMRKAAPLAAKEATESLLRTEIKAILGYDRYDPSGKNSGDSRNGTYQRTIQTSLGPISVEVPRDRNGEYKPIAIPRYRRRTDLITSAVLKLYSSGMTDDEMRLAVSSIYEALSSAYPKAKRQRCFVHLLRNVCSQVRPSHRSEAPDGFMSIAKQDCAESGKKALGDFVAKWKGEYPKLGLWSEKAENTLTFYEFPDGLRGLIYTNNRIESFNKQIKRTLKKQIQFVTEEALGKRLVSIFLHYNEGIGKRKVRCWREIVAYDGSNS